MFHFWCRLSARPVGTQQCKNLFLRESVAYPVLISAATPPTPPRNSAGGRALNRAFDFFGGYFAG